MRSSEVHSFRRSWKIAGLILFIVMTIGGAAAMSIASMKPSLDEISLCRRDIPLSISKLILVDTTDPLTANQLRQLKAAIVRARDSLPVDAKLTMLFLDASASHEPREIFSMCNPGSSANSNALFATASRIDKRWRDSFGQPLDDAIVWLKSAPTAEASPIMESVTAASQRPDFDSNVPNRELIIVSDLLQHQSGGYSHYQQANLWAAYKRSRLAIEAQPDLAGVSVEIVYLTRPSVAQFQHPRQRAFWTQWLVQAGASAVHFIGIPKDEEQALEVERPPKRSGERKNDQYSLPPKISPKTSKR